MAVTGDILATWRRPRRVMRRLLAGGAREDRALAILMGACAVIFVAQWPRLARDAHLDPSVPLDARLAGALLATVFILPLLAYGLAALSHVLARALGGRGTFAGARVALFWSLLATAPLMLFQGLVAGFLGPGPGLTLLGLVVLAAFLAIWGASLRVAEFEGA